MRNLATLAPLASNVCFVMPPLKIFKRNWQIELLNHRSGTRADEYFFIKIAKLHRGLLSRQLSAEPSTW